jgi:hypothetical protein
MNEFQHLRSLVAVLVIVHFWFGFCSFGQAAIFTWLGPGLLLLLQRLLVVLLACSALPDGASELNPPAATKAPGTH